MVGSFIIQITFLSHNYFVHDFMVDTKYMNNFMIIDENIIMPSLTVQNYIA